MPTIEGLICLGGVLHLMLLVASGLVPHELRWREELTKLGALTRQLVWVHGFFVVLTIIGLGLVSILHAGALAAGTPLARSLCGFIGLFWLARLGVQLLVFDARALVSGRPLLKIGYHGLTAVFTYLAIVYGVAALLPGTAAMP